METDNEKKYAITPLGILYLGTGSMEIAQALWECVQQHGLERGHNAIMLNGKGGSFIKIECEHNISIGLEPGVEGGEKNN